jgi:phthiodiolone/phenolphthiodiolone dimycocerosates ketoreductase
MHMTNRTVETAAMMWADRHMPPQAIVDACRALEQSGAVDGVLFADQLTNFLPAWMWTPENAPMAAMMGDPDSHSDAFIFAAYAHAGAPGLKLHVSTDSVRRPPAEQVQAMLTLANITGGRATFQIGGGEVKQTRPFGHPTKQGLSRLKDLFQIYRAFMDNDRPFDHHGKRWEFHQAFLGNAKTPEPEVWALGAGPTLIDYATSYADGLAVTVPMAWTSPEHAAHEIEKIRQQLTEKERDPDSFRIGLWAMTILHEDPAYIDRALENPILKWLSGIAGRIETHLWKDEGLAPLPFPDGWTYYKDLVPYEVERPFVESIIEATTREHQEKGWFIGSPVDVAARLQPWLDAGADWVMPMDYLPIVGDMNEAATALGRTIELCAGLRRPATEPVSA